jgi:hypothetical protein
MLVLSPHEHMKPWWNSKNVYLFRGEFEICLMHFVNDCKFQMNFEVVVLEIGLDVSQNSKVVIVKKYDTTIPRDIQVRKSENGCNIVFNSCIPFWNI